MKMCAREGRVTFALNGEICSDPFPSDLGVFFDLFWSMHRSESMASIQEGVIGDQTAGSKIHACRLQAEWGTV